MFLYGFGNRRRSNNFVNITALLMTAISQIVISNKDNKSEIIMKDQKKISIGTYLCISNIVFLILQNFILGVNI